MYFLPPDELCRVVQDDEAGQPCILLRRGAGQPVETLTIQQAHAVIDAHLVIEHVPDSECWVCALIAVADGIR